ncbi:hypothetical protein C5167_030461 [Papaver somniferum]|nr:hypothetical protein C5167_030461 [Papaver somniferum]
MDGVKIVKNELNTLPSSELGSSSATCGDENNQNLEPDLDKVEEENDEELVYHKLLLLVNEREKENCDSVGDEENVGVSCHLNASSVDFNCEPESIVDQLRQEVEEVKPLSSTPSKD